MVSDNPLVSIITPTYNHQRYIGACIESVLAQTYGRWELLVVDDGSNDRTWEIVQQYANTEGRIRCFRQENKGIWRLAESYNLALGEARGELIAILEGDDLWLPTKLSIQVPAHLAAGLTISFGQIRCVDASGKVLSTPIYPDARRHPFLLKDDPRRLFVRLLRGEYNPPAVTMMIVRDALAGAGGFLQPHYLPFVDYPTCVSVIANGGALGYVPEILGLWRRHPAQATRLLADSLFSGVYRFAWEFVEQHGIDIGVATECLGQYLMGPERRHFLSVGAAYQEVALALDAGDPQEAWIRCKELGQSARLLTTMLFQCLVMYAQRFAFSGIRRTGDTRKYAPHERRQQL